MKKVPPSDQVLEEIKSLEGQEDHPAFWDLYELSKNFGNWLKLVWQTFCRLAV